MEKRERLLKWATFFKQQGELKDYVEGLEKENRRLRSVFRKLGETLDEVDLLSVQEEVSSPHEIFGRPISSLELSIRANNCLDAARVKAIGELVRHTEQNLTKIRSFGVLGLREVKRKLTDLGLRLGMTEEEILAWEPPLLS